MCCTHIGNLNPTQDYQKMKESPVKAKTYSNRGPVVTEELGAKLQERLKRQGEGE